VEGPFRCPSNKITSVPFPDGPTEDFKAQPLVSYNTVRNFLYWPGDAESSAPFGEVSAYVSMGPTRLPSNYRPQISRVGNPSENIFIADGSRFTTHTGVVDHDVAWNGNFGGAFSDGGPTLRYVDGEPGASSLRSYLFDDPERRYSYRHARGANNPGIVAGYFDGHAGWMSEAQSRFPDPWWPKGTIIPRSDLNKASSTLVRDLMEGTNYRVRR
jgi:hypothetical protein